MSKIYPLLSLKDAGVELIDCVHATPKETGNPGYPYVGIPQLKDGRLDLSDARVISHEDMEVWNKRCNIRSGDIIVCRRCNSGISAVVPDNFTGSLGQNLVLLRSDEKTLYQDYLRWAVRGEEWWGEVQKYINVGAIFDSLKCKDIPTFQIPVPNHDNQKAIAHILGTLDDKIELNQKMNQTLEEIAKAIFKSWFVDFDPVRAKAEGRPTGLSLEISDLFPDELVDSEIGEIPRGWEVKTISDLAECVGGATPSTKNPDFWEGGNIAWTSPKDLSAAKSIHLLKTDKKITEAGLRKISSGLLPIGTVLLSSRAPVGYLALTTEPTAINQGYIALKPKSRISNYFLLNWCDSHLDEIKNRASGTTFAEISKAAFRPIPAVAPHNDVMEKFHEFASPIYERALVASKEAETLVELRDTLLPRLISGELRIPDAEKFLEEAGI